MACLNEDHIVEIRVKPSRTCCIRMARSIFHCFVTSSALAFTASMPASAAVDTDDDADAPPDSATCDFTDSQILDMIELVSGKTLDRGVGIGFVRSLDMEACGTAAYTPDEMKQHYVTLYADDWYILGEQTPSGAGWNAYVLAWGNDPTPTSCTWVKSIITGGGTAVQTYYGHDTMTITGEGTSITYLAFAAWLASS